MEVEIQNMDFYLTNHFKHDKPVKSKKKNECISYIFLSSAIAMLEDKLKSEDQNKCEDSLNNSESTDIDYFGDNNIYEDNYSDNEYIDDDDYYYDSYDDLGDDIEFNLTYNFKLKFNRSRSNTKCLRNKKHNKTGKHKKMVNVISVKKLEKYRENVLNNTSERKPIIQTTNNVVYNSYNNLYNEEEALRRAINESRNVRTSSSGLTYQQILDIQTRDLTPEDYELLLILDESLPKKTLKENQLSSFDTFTLKALSDINAELCPICMDMFQIGEELKKLKCNHIFHTTCINNWLSSYSTNCPVDGLSLV